MKARILALEARYTTLLSWVGELHTMVTGEAVRVHPDDQDGLSRSEWTLPAEEE